MIVAVVLGFLVGLLSFKVKSRWCGTCGEWTSATRTPRDSTGERRV